jgi:hypothetical protein
MSLFAGLPGTGGPPRRRGPVGEEVCAAARAPAAVVLEYCCARPPWLVHRCPPLLTLVPSTHGLAQVEDAPKVAEHLNRARAKHSTRPVPPWSRPGAESPRRAAPARL